ncbi:hypothetical protein, partial [Kitasatospora putterlickiae]|uniref:hypothetical protein n=1 Tax=Kitasatospora putterlickiae TaxID=221725 RepID=UPI0031D905AC
AHQVADPGTAAGHGFRTDPPGTFQPNGTTRRRVWFLDPSLPPDSPLAVFPSRWHRRADAPDPVHYPDAWSAGEIQVVADTALLGDPGRRVPLADGRTFHVVGEAYNVRVEGLVRDGRILVHRPLDQQVPWRQGTHDDGLPTTVVARATDSLTHTVGAGRPVTVRRALFNTRETGLEVSVRLHLAPGDGTAATDLAGYRRGLQEAADQLVRGQSPMSPVRLRLEFTDNPEGAFSSVRVESGAQPRLADHVRDLLDAGAGHDLELVAQLYSRGLPRTPLDVPLPDPVPGSLREPGVPDPAGPPRTTDAMAQYLAPVRAAFADGAWERTGQGVPPHWTADDGRFAAYLVATGRAEGVQMVPRLHEDGPGTVFEGTVAGSLVRATVSGNRITGYVVRPGDAEAGAAPAPAGPRRVLATAEVTPPADALRGSIGARDGMAFEASRVLLPDGDTETVLRLRVHLDTSTVTLARTELDAALKALHERAERGVGVHFNRGQRLPGGDLLRVEVVFTDDPAGAHHVVKVHENWPRESSHNWNLRTDEFTLAHELGHTLGLPDEYREAAWKARPVYQDGALMAAQSSDGFDHFLLDMDRNDVRSARNPLQGLPPRYLREFGSVVDAALGTPDGP